MQRDWKRFRADHGGTKPTIKADINVLASSIAAGAAYLFTEDAKIGAIAKGRIQVLPLTSLEGTADLFG